MEKYWKILSLDWRYFYVFPQNVYSIIGCERLDNQPLIKAVKTFHFSYYAIQEPILLNFLYTKIYSVFFVSYTI